MAGLGCGILAGVGLLLQPAPNSPLPEAAGTPAAERDPGASVSPAVVMSPAEPAGSSASAGSELLIARLQAARASLPKISVIRAEKGADLHQTPDAVIAAGAAIGDLQEHLAAHPEDFAEASLFYADCFGDADILPAIRALCLHSVKEKPDQWAPGVKERIATVPAAIRDIESEL